MFFSIFAIVIVLVLLIKRIVTAKNPKYIYKNKIIEDRPIEMIGMLLVIVAIITSVINDFILESQVSKGPLIFNIVVFIVLILIIILDHNKFKVGIYENGILYRSTFYKWEKIYSYRNKNIGDNRSRITFYMYDTRDREKLNKFHVTTVREKNDEIIKAIGNNLDPTRS